MPGPGSGGAPRLSQDERAAVYKCIYNRRDVRRRFVDRPLDDAVLARILDAAHHAPSVGFMQPWDFVVVRDPTVKETVFDAFRRANAEAAALFPDARRDAYLKLKLEGIRQAPVNLCVTCDRTRAGPVVLGRTHQPEMDVYSVVCAVQTLWLAARAENIGVGWVSILTYDDLRAALAIPPDIQPVAYLCLGHVDGFADRPELETAGWRERLPLTELVWFDRWRNRRGDEPLLGHLGDGKGEGGGAP